MACEGNKIQLHARREVGTCRAHWNGEEHSEPSVSSRTIVDARHLLIYLQAAARLHALLTARAAS